LSKEILEVGIPVLGICWGMQFINYASGGEVTLLDKREDGQFEVDISPESAIFKSMDPKQKVLLTHGDSITKVASGFDIIARVAHGGIFG
jgi:GMP synthase (glutamine-hydrolysing)